MTNKRFTQMSSKTRTILKGLQDLRAESTSLWLKWTIWTLMQAHKKAFTIRLKSSPSMPISLQMKSQLCQIFKMLKRSTGLQIDCFLQMFHHLEAKIQLSCFKSWMIQTLFRSLGPHTSAVQMGKTSHWTPQAHSKYLWARSIKWLTKQLKLVACTQIVSVLLSKAIWMASPCNTTHIKPSLKIFT